MGVVTETFSIHREYVLNAIDNADGGGGADAD